MPPKMDSEAELERIRQFSTSARQRLRRLDVLLDEQMRILDLDPALNSRDHGPKGRSISRMELRFFAGAFGLAALGAFLAGFWIARLTN